MIQLIITLLTEIGGLVAVIIPLVQSNRKIKEGVKCQLRSDMLRIYYHHLDLEEIRQYEYENFVMLYEAYKALKGNSFIDEIHNKVTEWKIVS